MSGLSRICAWSVLLSGLTAALAASGGDKVSLAKDGAALAEIVVATNVTPSAWMAALEIQLHLKEITGADFAIVKENATTGKYPILVGESHLTKHRSADFAKQEWYVEVGKTATEILGLDDPKHKMKPLPKLKITKENGVEGGDWPGLFNKSGTLYAGYEFLETVCGVRWLDSTEYGTITPKDDSFAIAETVVRGRPWADYRGGTIEYRHDQDCRWAEGPERKAYVQRSHPHGDKERKLRQLLYYYRHRAGGEYRMANHSFGFFFDRYLNKKSKNFVESHPEYFAQGPEGSVPQQLCYMHPEVIRITLETIRFYFDHTAEEMRSPKFENGKWRGMVGSWYNSLYKRWGEDTYCLEPMDGRGGFCTCERCSKFYEPERGGDNSGDSTYWFNFVKIIAEEIKKSHPDKRLTTLAYAGHEGLPTNCRLPDNVDVFFCFSSARSGGKGAADQLARMRAWHEAYPNMKLGAWMYTCYPEGFGYEGHYHAFPANWAHNCGKTFRDLKELNACAGFFHCGLPNELNSYQIMKLMIDPEASTDLILDDFFAKYGKAAPAIRAYYTICEDRFNDRSCYPKGTSFIGPKQQWERLGTKEIMDRLEVEMKRALELAKDESFEVRERVQLFKMNNWDYMKKGFDDYWATARLPKPTFVARRIASCGGDAAKVDWKAIPAERTKMFRGGTARETDFDREFRAAHDGEYLYMEFRSFVPTARLVTQKRIYPNDDIEIVVARQPAQPFRTIFGAPDGRTTGLSFGEVNWRQQISPEYDGKPPSWGVKYVSDTSDPNCWRVTWAFRLKDQIAVEPVLPGDTVYFNITNVLGKDWNKEDPSYWLVQTMTSLTRVHCTDRMAEVTLEK